VKWLGRFVFPRRRIEVQNRSLNMLDWGAPDRVLASGGPWYWAENGRDENGAVQIELYPGSSQREVLYYTYWESPQELTLLDELPKPIELYVLREGALIDLYRYRASQEANAGRHDVAGYWRNESRAQSTSWEREIMDAIRSDRSVDDVSFIYQFLGQDVRGGSYDVQNARDEIYIRGARP